MADHTPLDPTPYLTALLAGLLAETKKTTAGAPEWAGLVPARTVVQDFCGAECGMGFVRLDSVYASTERFPTADTAVQRSSRMWAVKVEVGVYRCLPIEAPTPEESTVATVQQMEDHGAILRTLACGTGVLRGRPYVLGTYLPVGPNGGCGGGSWTATYQVLR